MNKLLFTIALVTIELGLNLSACGGTDTPSENKQMTTKELVAAAAAGDKNAMDELVRQTAQKAHAEKIKISVKGQNGDPLAAFQTALMSTGDSESKIQQLAENGNPHARLWRALSVRGRVGFTAIDKEGFRNTLLHIATSGKQYKYAGIAGETYPLSAEAAFQISEDKLSQKWLFDLDNEGAIQYLRQAAEGGHPKAMYKLATRYQYGLDMSEDMTKAKSWLEKSAAAGNHDAKRALKKLAE